MAEFFVGTSGWSYSTWRYEGFYPQDLPSRQWLPYYAGRFNSAEVNYSFYHLPRATTYAKWYGETPDRFVFALKASRTITHVKFLKSVKREWKKFAAGSAWAQGQTRTDTDPVSAAVPCHGREPETDREISRLCRR
jgi:uncharacterized protein YecE (DUF72 family)